MSSLKSWPKRRSDKSGSSKSRSKRGSVYGNIDLMFEKRRSDRVSEQTSKQRSRSTPKSDRKSERKSSRKGSSKGSGNSSSSEKETVVLTNGSKEDHFHRFVHGEERGAIIKRLNDDSDLGSRYYFTDRPTVETKYLIRPNNAHSEGGNKRDKAPHAKGMTISDFLRMNNKAYLIERWNIIV